MGDHHIDINPLMLEEYDLATLKQVVLHELMSLHASPLNGDGGLVTAIATLRPC